MTRKLCTEEGCEDQTISRGLCPKHYQALRRREKDPLVGTRRRGPVKRVEDAKCSTKDCGLDVYAKGLCSKHYRKKWRQDNQRSYAEKVLILWDTFGLHDLDWRVMPGGLEFLTFLGDESVVLDPRSFKKLDTALNTVAYSSNGDRGDVVDKVFEEWFKEHSSAID